jgi:dipeptidyl aminopeptidase/acylaminoacyl peptidase
MHPAAAFFGLTLRSRVPASSGTICLTRYFLVVCLLGCACATESAAQSALANGKIAFTSDRDGNQEIYSMNDDGSDPRRLTNNPGVDCFPAFSADGTKIAFVRQNISGAFAIAVMNADGTEAADITLIDFKPSPFPWHHSWALSWSPDGRKIAFEEGGDIFTVNLDGTMRRNLTEHPALDFEPSWSADGARILFVSSRVYWLTLHGMNADGSDVRELPSGGEFWDMSPDFARTGDKIAFVVHSEMSLPVIYSANIDGTERRLFDGSGYGSSHRNKPRWSPDGKKLVFHIWDYFGGDTQIHVKNAAGEVVQLTRATGRNFQPSWQAVPAGVP